MNAIKEARYNLGIAYLNDEQFKEAIPEFEAVIQLDPDYIDAHCGLSRAYLEINDLDKAEISTLAALKLNPDYPSVKDLSESIKTTYYENGITLLESKNYQKAIITFQKVVLLDSNYKDTNYYLGRSFLGVKDYEKAVDSLQRSISSNNINEDVHFLIGNAFVELKQFQEAIKHLNDAIVRNPNQIDAHYYLARAHRESGNLEASTNAAIETLRLDPKYQPIHILAESIKQTHYNNGITFLKDERYSDAIASLQNVITLDPDYTAAQYNMGIAYLKMENYSRALDNLQKTISLDPRNKDAQHGLALTFLGLGELDNARNAAKEALSIDSNYQPAKTLLEALDPTFKADSDDTTVDAQDTTPKGRDGSTDSTPTGQPRHEAHYATGMAYLDAGKIDEAISEFQKALDLKSDYVDANLGLSKAYFQNRQLDEAENSVHEVLRIDPNSHDAKQLLEEIKGVSKKDSVGEDAKNEIVPQEDIDIDKELELGLVYLNQNLYQRAIETFEKVIQANPDSVEGYSRLGQAYLACGGYDDAKASAEKALELNPNHNPSQDIIKTIKFIRKAEKNVDKRKKVLLYASIVLVVFAGLFITYRYQVFPFSIVFDSDFNQTGEKDIGRERDNRDSSDPKDSSIGKNSTIQNQPKLSIDSSLVNRYGKQSNQVFSGQNYTLNLIITNRGAAARNIRLRIFPNSIKGLLFTIPNKRFNITKNKNETINIKITSNTRAVTSKNKLNITLVDSENKTIAAKEFTLSVLGPDPID